MKLTRLLIAVVVLAGLLGALYYSQHHVPDAKPVDTSAVAPKILSFDEEGIEKIAIRRKDSPEVTLVKDASGQWKMTSPKSFGVDPEAISGLTSTLSSLSSDRVIEEKAPDLNPYGLNQPASQIAVTEKGGQTHTLLIGDTTPAGNLVYAKLEGSPRVYTITGFDKTKIDRDANDLRDKRLLPVEADKVSRIEIAAAKQSLEFGRDKLDWQILRPQPARADSSEVSQLLSKLTDAKIDTGLTNDALKQAAASFASGTPVAVARLSTPGGVQELQVRQHKNQYYGKSGAAESAYPLSSDLGEWLARGPNDYRNKKVFDFGYDDPTRIEIQEGGKSRTWTRSGDQWSADGTAVDKSGVETLINYLRDLSATDFPSAGFTQPALSITVNSKGGQRTERVSFARKGADYLARRDNELGLYQLAAKPVDDMLKVAGESKAPPSAAPAPAK